MRRCRHTGCAAEVVAPTGRIPQMDRALEAAQMTDAQAIVEVQQVGAAAEEYMLAVVEHLAGLRLLERARAATERAAGLDQGDTDTAGRFQRDRSGHASEAAADDDRARKRRRAGARKGSSGCCRNF